MFYPIIFLYLLLIVSKVQFWSLCRLFSVVDEHRLNGFAKSPRVLRWSRILNECNLSWKMVKYCILYEVCMIKTAPHSTLSPQTWCLKKYKRLVCTHPDLLARICKVNSFFERKKFDLICFPRICFPNLLWSRAIIALKCDRRLFFGSAFKAINSMQDLFIYSKIT